MGFDKTLKKTFPGSVTMAQLVEEIDQRVSELGFSPEMVKPAISFCRDDSTHALLRLLDDQGYSPSFKLHALAGMPVYGIDSIGAWYHHIPDLGLGLIVYGPHIGIDSEGNLGQLDRHGKEEPGASCGANHILLKRWKDGNLGPYEKSPELSTVSGMLSDKSDDVLNDTVPILRIVGLEYSRIRESLLDYVQGIKASEHHDYPVLMVGGVHIDAGTGNMFQIKDIDKL